MGEYFYIANLSKRVYVKTPFFEAKLREWCSGRSILLFPYLLIRYRSHETFPKNVCKYLGSWAGDKIMFISDETETMHAFRDVFLFRNVTEEIRYDFNKFLNYLGLTFSPHPTFMNWPIRKLPRNVIEEAIKRVIEQQLIDNPFLDVIDGYIVQINQSRFQRVWELNFVISSKFLSITMLLSFIDLIHRFGFRAETISAPEKNKIRIVAYGQTK